MDTNLQFLKKFYSELDVADDVGSIDQRLILQKVALLGQSFGVSLDYSYNWYVKGPYSPALTEDYYAMQGYSDDSINFEFNEDVKNRLNRLSKIIHKYDNENSGSIMPKWVEALASLVFLIKKSYKTDEEALRVLETQKSHIDANMRQDALKVLRENQLI